MKSLLAAPLFLFLSVPILAQEVSEPHSGVKFAAKDGDMSLLGVGLRTKTMLKVKVYAAGLYVADSALSGSLKRKAGSPELYKQLVSGDFRKQMDRKFLRDVSTSQIRDAFRESLGSAGPGTEEWLTYFGDLKSGPEIKITVLVPEWSPY